MLQESSTGTAALSAAPRIPPSAAKAIALCSALHYCTDTEPGINRRRAGKGFYYVTANGRRVTDPDTLARIRKLAIPPAYKDVWICADASGHIQATGIDARGRKQYRYHAKWREVRDAHKFERMAIFGRALPRMRRRIARDLKLPGMPREKVLAAVVRLLERTLIRVGNVEYARSNGSYGLTTLRNHHVRLKGDTVKFRFRGKHGIEHDVEIADPRAAKIIRGCLDLPGQDLFEYVEQGVVHDIGSSHVNQYLQQISGEDFTAKDFRTWHATSDALEALAGLSFSTAREAQQNVKEVLEAVAGKLGNTPAMCRKCYVNPVVIDAFLAGELRDLQLAGGAHGRARLLLLLTRTPGGAGFKRRAVTKKVKRPAGRKRS